MMSGSQVFSIFRVSMGKEGCASDVLSSEAKQRRSLAVHGRCLTRKLQGMSWSATQALEGIVSSLSELQKEMSSWGVPEPEDGWKTWSLAFRNAKKDAAISMREEGSTSLESN